MRNLKNKKLLAPVIAGVLATMMIIGIGTYAWFTASTTSNIDGQYWAAKVGIEEKASEYNAYDFYPGAAFEYTRQFQGLIENWANAPDPWTKAAEFDLRFRSLYDGFVGNPLKTVLTAMDVPPATPKVNEVILIQNPFNKTIHNNVFTNVYNITPGSILEAKYSFNTLGLATIPVYFRISETALVDANTGLATDFEHGTTYLASLIGTKADASKVVELFGSLIEGADGYYYCPVPLSPEYGWEIEVINLAYIFGAANSDPALHGQFVKFAGVGGPVTAELIQATNNAVYMADGWKAVAADLVPYVEADLYNVYIANWTGNYPEHQ